MVTHPSLRKGGRKHAWSKDVVTDKDLAGSTGTIIQDVLGDQGRGWSWASLASGGGGEMMLALKPQLDVR